MIRLHYAVELNYQVGQPGADFIFNLQPAHTAQQQVIDERLTVSQPVPLQADLDPQTRTRWLRLHAQSGPLKVSSQATVVLNHHLQAPTTLGEVWVSQLPGAVLPYLYPSRYCESDRLHAFAVQQFGTLWQGYSRVMAIRDWVNRHVGFHSNTSNSSTSACDTLVSRKGVCRDFAHLMIALCRAVNIPARFVTGFDYGADPALGPPDFHAYVEAYVGNRWFVFDPSGTAIPLGLLRLATGRDAADAAFATIFGPVEAGAPQVHIKAVAGADGQVVWPLHQPLAVSTDAG